MDHEHAKRSRSRLVLGVMSLGVAGLVGLAGALYLNTGAPKSLLLPEPLSALPDLGDYAWNPLARSQPLALLLWLAVVEAVGWLAWPVAATVCQRLPDRGFPLSKTLGLVLVAWPVWLAASLRLAPFTVWSILGAVGLLAGLAAWLWRRQGGALRAYLGRQRRLIFAWEGLYLVAFGAFLALRLLDPDLWQPARGGEKPMDFGFLNALLRSAWMPPPDPFFAGGYINYYYYGQFVVGCLIKLIGVAPAVGYNLALPLLYALLVLGAGSLVYNAVATIRAARGARAGTNRTAFGWGLVGVAFVALAGNLQGGLQTLSMIAPGAYSPLLGLFQSWGLTSPGMSKMFTSFEYWPVSRVAPRIIDEFPYWIFLFGELHAHQIALPFTLLVLGLALNLLLGGWGMTPPPAPPRHGEGWAADGGGLGQLLLVWGAAPAEAVVSMGVTALALGALAVINTWDFVTYGAILAAVGALAGIRVWRGPAAGGTIARHRLALALALGLCATLALALLAYAPYFLHFQALYNQIRPLLEGVNGQRRTKLAEWLIIWGLFAFIIISYLIAGLRRYPWAAAWAGLRELARGPRPVAAEWGFALVAARPAAPVVPPLEGERARGLLPPAVGLLVLLGAGVIAAGCLAVAQWLIALLVALLGGMIALHLSSVRTPGLRFGGVLLAGGLAANLGVELFYVADFLQTTEWFRMNTVFKFYMQGWVLFGSGSAIALYALLGQGRRAQAPAVRSLGRLVRGLWAGLLGLLALGAGIFLVLGTQSRLADAFPVRPAGPTLDGMAFMDGNQFAWGPITNTVTVDLRYDHAAYDWLLAQVHGLPVIATAPTAPDPEGMFVATYTGFPVVVGSMHQEEQRDPDQVAARRSDMATLFRTPDAAQALALLRKYDVAYIYVGPYERSLAGDAPGALAKFRTLAASALEVAYQNPGVTIYHVRAPGQ